MRRNRRSFILTQEGLEKIEAALQEVAEQQGFGVKGFSIEKISEIACLSTDTVRRIMRAEEAVDEKSIKIFAKAFQVDPIEGVDYVKPDCAKPGLSSQNLGNREELRSLQRIRLPRQTNEFIGREEELKQLLGEVSLNYRAPVITVDGIGGVGKTALVLEAAYLCLEASVYGESKFNAPVFESIIFTSAKDNDLLPHGIITKHPSQIQDTLRDIFQVIAHTLDDQTILQASPEEQIDRVYETLGHQTTLLIIDNFETIQDKEPVISFLLRLPDRVKAVITTRDLVVLYGCIRLDSLPERDSLCLINQQVIEKGVQLNIEDAFKLYQRFKGVPVALIYGIGQLASGYPLESVLSSSAPLPEDIARFCFEESVQRLRNTSAHCLLMAQAMFRRGPSRIAVATVAGLAKEPEKTNQGLAHLQQISLISFRADRYRMLPLTREYALAELAEHPEFEKAARKRWFDLYLDFAQQYGGKDWKNWYQRYDFLDEEWKNLLAVVDWCASQENYDDVKSIWKHIDHFSSLYGYWKDRLFWLKWLLEASERRGDYQTNIETRSEIGFTLISMGELSQAEETLLWGWKHRELSSLESQMFLAQQLALLRICQRQFDKALLWLHRGEKLSEQGELTPEEFSRRRLAILELRAKIFYEIGQYEQANMLYKAIVDKASEIDWQRMRNTAQHCMAEIAILRDRFDEAEKLLERGLPEAEKNKAKKSVAQYQKVYAHLEEARGNQDSACEWATRAIGSFKALGMLPEANQLSSQYHNC